LRPPAARASSFRSGARNLLFQGGSDGVEYVADGVTEERHSDDHGKRDQRDQQRVLSEVLSGLIRPERMKQLEQPVLPAEAIEVLIWAESKDSSAPRGDVPPACGHSQPT
jgi:hypothetical protein